MESHTVEALARAERLGETVNRFLESEAGRQAVTLVRAELYDEWKQGVSTQARERAFFETQAFDRLMDRFHQLVQNGVHAQEARRLIDMEDL